MKSYAWLMWYWKPGSTWMLEHSLSSRQLGIYYISSRGSWWRHWWLILITFFIAFTSYFYKTPNNNESKYCWCQPRSIHIISERFLPCLVGVDGSHCISRFNILSCVGFSTVQWERRLLNLASLERYGSSDARCTRHYLLLPGIVCLLELKHSSWEKGGFWNLPSRYGTWMHACLLELLVVKIYYVMWASMNFRNLAA